MLNYFLQQICFVTFFCQKQERRKNIITYYVYNYTVGVEPRQGIQGLFRYVIITLVYLSR